MKRKRILTVAIIAWILFIFCRSLQPSDLSTMESQWVLDLIQRLLPFDVSMHFVRKAAHFTEFAILGILAGLLFGERCTGLWQGSLFSLMISVSIALCDETIQLFVPGRTGKVQDVWLDISGTAAGALVALMLHRCRKRRGWRNDL